MEKRRILMQDPGFTNKNLMILCEEKLRNFCNVRYEALISNFWQIKTFD